MMLRMLQSNIQQVMWICWEELKVFNKGWYELEFDNLI